MTDDDKRLIVHTSDDDGDDTGWFEKAASFISDKTQFSVQLIKSNNGKVKVRSTVDFESPSSDEEG